MERSTLSLCFAQSLCCMQRTLIRAGTRNRLGPLLIESTFPTPLCHTKSCPSRPYSNYAFRLLCHPFSGLPFIHYPVFELTPTIFSSLPSLVLLSAFATMGVSGNIHSLRSCSPGSSFKSTRHRPWISIGPPSTFASGSCDLLGICVNISSWI